MKEKIFEILHNRKRMPGERFSDIEGKIEEFFNQEVEKRIKEIAKEAWFEGMKQGIKFDREDRNIKTIMETEPRVSFDDWLRSRLTNPNNNPK